MKIFKLDRSKRNYTHPDHPKHVHLEYKHSKDSSDKIRIVTYNIQYAKKIKQAIALIESNENLNHADIICLQEMDADGVKHLAGDLGYNYVYYPAVKHPTHGRDFGNAILSKWTISHHKKIILPYIEKNKLQRIAVLADIHINSKKVTVLCLHLQVFQNAEIRKKQLKSIVHSIPKHVKYCIVAGDFNTITKKSYHAIIDPFFENGFDLATKNIAWSYKHWYLLNKKTSLDHIFSKGMSLIKTDKVVSKKPSDHFPVWAQMEMMQ